MNVSQALKNCPKSVFHTGKGEDRRPNYPAIFTHVVCAVLTARGPFDKHTVEKIAEAVNISSLQRQIALEAARRRDGDSKPVAKAAAKRGKVDPAIAALEQLAAVAPKVSHLHDADRYVVEAMRRKAKPKKAKKIPQKLALEALAKARAAKAAEDLI